MRDRSFSGFAVRIFAAFCVVCLAVLAPVALVRAEMTDAQRNLLRQSAAAQKEAGAAFQAGKFDQSGEKLREAMLRAGEALEGADADVYEAAGRLVDGIERAHVMLQLEGIVLPPFEKPVFGKEWKVYVSEADIVVANAGGEMAAADKPAGTRPSRTPARPPKNETAEPAMENGISFVNQVAPILIGRCGNCHVTGNRGQFSMPSYAMLMKGPAAGVVVFAGDPVGSRLIETIETGDMPRGGGKVPATELQILKDWVAQGAKFDGPAPGAPLTSYATGTAAPTPSAGNDPAVAMSKGGETVSFAKQIAPLLVENCNGCHLDAMQIRGGLNMNSVASLMRGGDSGEVIKPGDGDGSLLVRKLRGQEGARMPAGGRPALPEESIQLISTWISEGATLDEGTPDQNLRVMMTEAWAKNATHEELAARRQEMAASNWKLGVPADARESAVTAETDDVLVMGNVDQELADLVAKAAGEGLNKARTYVPMMDDRKDTGKAKYRGRVTIFLFPKRYDYSEFSKMVETRSVPSEWDVHWRYNGVDAYVSMVVSADESVKALTGRLTAPLASLTVAQLGPAPRWFQEGIGRAIASKTAARDFDGWKGWDQQIPDAVGVVKESKELIENKLPPEQADLIGYAIGKTMIDRQWRQQFNQLLKNLHTGAEFDQAFMAAFRMPLENYVKAWFGY